MLLSVSLCLSVSQNATGGGSVWTVMLLSVCVCPKTRPGGSVLSVFYAFPDLEEVFSAEEILTFWGEVEEGA